MPKPDRLAEIQARMDRLNADRTLTGGTWTASPVNDKSVLPPEQAHVVEDVVQTASFVTRASVGVFGDERHAQFAAAAREDMPWLVDEIVRLRAETQTLGTEKGLLEERFAQLRAELEKLRNTVAAHIWDGMTTHDNGLAAAVATLQVALTKAGLDLTAEVDHLADAEREAGREDYEEAVS